MPTCACGFACDRKYSMDRHRKTSKHEMKMAALDCDSINGVFSCKKCDYKTPLKGNFRRHVMSNVHRMVDEEEEAGRPPLLIEVMEMFMKHHETTLKHHETTLKHQETMQLQSTEMLAKHMQASDMQNMFQALADRIATPVQQIQSNNTNSHNKKFNLNLFLNEDCKDAPNLTDFVKSVVISMEDLEHLGQVGYTEGMTKILTKAIQDQDQTGRPMHCTDVKRETIYIRENDAWKKDLQREETTRAIEHIAHKNYKAFMEWRNQHPEHAIPDTDDYETWYRISRSMCNTDPSAMKKLVHHLATMTAIEKEESS